MNPMPEVSFVPDVPIGLQYLQTIFRCQQCGKCCRSGGNPLLTDHDIGHIAVFFNCSPCNEQLIPVVPCTVPGYKYQLALTSPCFFQDKLSGLCLIHSVKPQNCREWPFISLAKGLCNIEHLLPCPEASRLLYGLFGIKRGEP